MKIAGPGKTGAARRTPLTRDRVVAAGIGLADREGIESISMRRVAQELGVEAMSLYTHVRTKDDLLDGMVDAVIGEIPTGTVDVAGGPEDADRTEDADRADRVDWKSSLRRMSLAARAVVLAHPWAPQPIETRTAPGPATIRYIDAVLGVLREGGFTVAQAHHALHILGSRLLGFTQMLFDDSGDGDPETAAAIADQLRPAFPFVAEMALAVAHSGVLGPCDDDVEFTFALDFLLDGLERMLQRG
ncbi:AcrR family transcriptional regulator [Catenulispora sp. EB89]|uniref:TetR/AcrR family transcriptional regulator n=1 Tax=Catenulispora sp. EB89 TaxID=3156257 RepID=UPI003512337E